MLWIDTPVKCVSSFDSVFVVPKDAKRRDSRPVLGRYSMPAVAIEPQALRDAQGSCRDAYLLLRIVVGLVFLFIEAAALAMEIGGGVLISVDYQGLSRLYRWPPSPCKPASLIASQIEKTRPTG